MYYSPSLTGTQCRMNQGKMITKYMHITLTSFMSDFVHLQCREVD